MVEDSVIVVGVIILSVGMTLFSMFTVNNAVKYAYTNARVRAMKSHLLSQQSVRAFCEMGRMEIISNLESQNYKDIVLELEENFSLENIQHALNWKSYQLDEKLMRIVPKSDAPFFECLSESVNVQNIKVLVRLKIAQKFGSEFKKLLVSTKEFPESMFDELLSCSLDELNVKLRFTFFKDFADGLDIQKISVTEFEKKLDAFYCTRLLKAAKKNRDVLKYARLLIDLHNVRMMEGGRDWIEGGILSRADAESIVEGKAVHGYFHKHLSGAGIGALRLAIERSVHEEGSILLSKNPLSINGSVGYHILKEAEIHNLKRILKLKALDVAPARIAELLV